MIFKSYAIRKTNQQINIKEQFEICVACMLKRKETVPHPLAQQQQQKNTYKKPPYHLNLMKVKYHFNKVYDKIFKTKMYV